MKIFHKGLVALLLASMLVQAESSTKDVEAHQTEFPETTLAQAQTRTISTILPSYTEIMLETGESKFGKLTAIEPEAKKLTLVLHNEQYDSTALSEIERVEFRIDDGTVRGKPLPPFLGEKRTWPNVPLDKLRVLPDKGRVEVTLPCTANTRECQEKRTSYRLDELSFPDENKVTLVVSAAN